MLSSIFFKFFLYIYHFFGQIKISEKKTMNDMSKPTSSIKNPGKVDEN